MTFLPLLACRAMRGCMDVDFVVPGAYYTVFLLSRFWRRGLPKTCLDTRGARISPGYNRKTFLRNHAAGIASIYLFVVRSFSFKLLCGFVSR